MCHINTYAKVTSCKVSSCSHSTDSLKRVCLLPRIAMPGFNRVREITSDKSVAFDDALVLTGMLEQEAAKHLRITFSCNQSDSLSYRKPKNPGPLLARPGTCGSE